MRLLADESASYQEVSNLIRADPAFSIEILRLANSSVFSFRYEVKDIPHAVAVLGMSRLRGMVMTLAMKDFLLSFKQQEAVKLSWRHSLASALTCEKLAQAYWVESGLAYTAGLLHNVGMLAFAATRHDSYVEMMRRPYPDVSAMLREEENAFGMNHCEFGRLLLKDWGLPEEFQVAAAMCYLHPSEAPSDFNALVSLGSYVAGLCGFPVYETDLTFELDGVLAILPEQAREVYREKLKEFPLELATKINSFDCDFLS